MKSGWIVLLLLVGCASRHDDVIATYQGVYHKPLMSPGGKFATLPPGVQNTVRAQTGSAEISQIIDEKISGKEVYTVLFQNRDLFPPLIMARDGSILNPNLTYAMGAPGDPGEVLTGSGSSGIRLSDLPPGTLKALQERAPGARVASIEKQTWGEQTVYTITFQDKDRPRMYIASDGVVLKETPK